MLTKHYIAAAAALAGSLTAGTMMHRDGGDLALVLADIYGDGARGTLGKAICDGDGPRVRQIFEEGVTPNEKTLRGETPLMQAVKCHQPGMIPLLIEKGADVKLPIDDRGSTVMREAVTDSHDKAVFLALIDAGADINAVAGGWTPMQWAVLTNNLVAFDAARERGILIKELQNVRQHAHGEMLKIVDEEIDKTAHAHRPVLLY